MQRSLRLFLPALLVGVMGACGTPAPTMHQVDDLAGDTDVHLGDWNPEWRDDPDGDCWSCGPHDGVDLDLDWEVLFPGFGKQCSQNSDCQSALCVALNPTQSVCTVSCVDECPNSWRCVLLPDSGPDLLSACMPPTLHLCDVCQKDSDCQFPGDMCLPMGTIGTFCAMDCQGGQDCPPDYVCSEIRDENDLVKGQQCLPKTGSCDCTPTLNGKVRDCVVSNSFGECHGQETCDGPSGWTGCTALTPAADLCNGVDDNCDGEMDDAFVPVPCTRSNATGECSGMTVCLGTEGATCGALEPAAETCDLIDNNCNGEIDEGFPDSDLDGDSDCKDQDDDNDGVLDLLDNCPFVSNLGQVDTDHDDLGDKCDPDDDNDGTPDQTDNCPLISNPGQLDTDQDGIGDSCEGDSDQDGKPDVTDNCPFVANADQLNSDADALGDVCDPDDDNDLVPDDGDESGASDDNPCGLNGFVNCDDNCHFFANSNQADLDKDGLGDLCDGDVDGDGDLNVSDCKPYDPTIYAGQKESCNGWDDNCNGQVDEGFLDSDKDLQADCMDPDDDNDLDPDVSDCAPWDNTVFHGAPELCNGYDDDCSGFGDEGCPASQVALHLAPASGTVWDETYILNLRVVAPGGVSEDTSAGYRITWSSGN